MLMDSKYISINFPKSSDIWKVSDPRQVIKLFYQFYGTDNKLLITLSKKQFKKYTLHLNNKVVHFGDIRYEDYTHHKDKERRRRYLARSTNIKGNWASNLYSANNLAIKLLW